MYTRANARSAVTFVGEEDPGREDDELEEVEPADGSADELADGGRPGQLERVAGSQVEHDPGVGLEEVVELGPRPPIDDVGIGLLEPGDPDVVDRLKRDRRR